MTEGEWRDCSDWREMISFLADRASPRKLRLFLCGCCRGVLSRLDDVALREAVETAERCVDGRATKFELYVAHGVADNASVAADYAIQQAEAEAWHIECGYVDQENERQATAPESVHRLQQNLRVAHLVMGATFEEMGFESLAELPLVDDGTATEEDERVQYIRDIFGNPFAPTHTSPSWLDQRVRHLALVIYEQRAFMQMPELADALQDAGCTDDEVLNHCRAPISHVPGCWVLDRLLGKG